MAETFRIWCESYKLVQIDFTPQGICLPDIGLWLDPQDKCENSWISHGHTDHARGLHCKVIGTTYTLRIYRMRWPEDAESTQHLSSLDYGESMDFHGARLTAYPAGHIVGAAQLLIEWKGERIVYTGDIKLRPPICGATTQVVPCDRLIIESTFGLPIYHFLSREEARERMVLFARQGLAEGTTPVFIGYPLGRGQEAVHVLCQAGIPTAVHGSIARMIPVYESAGYALPGWIPYAAKDTEGKALVVVPNFRATMEASGKNTRFAYVSGWAALDNARARSGAEELIPYSDHGDFDELLALVEQSGATEVDVVHGYSEAFASILSQRGVIARAPRALAARAGEEVPEG
jgi:Cft2 family RNA processing exonuclease